MIKRHIRWLLPALSALACACCLLGYSHVSGLLLSQSAAERWQGENEQRFAQISCFMAADQGLEEEQLFSFRTAMVQKLVDASFEVERDTELIHDAWCAYDKARISRGQKSAQVSLCAVGGSYFSFHPLPLISGSYIGPEDLMEDRVLLDRDCAWLLFGGTELEGLSFQINGKDFVVAGVIDREDDRWSRLAYDKGMGLYMSWEAYKKLSDAALIDCYELVMAEPVEGFVYNAAKEKFPIGKGEIVDNSRRYEPERILKMLKGSAARSMRLNEAIYPYWENAARGSEDTCLKLLLAAVLSALLPVWAVCALFVKVFKRGRRKLREELAPKALESLQEAHRLRARKRWEKKHPNMK